MATFKNAYQGSPTMDRPSSDKLLAEYLVKLVKRETAAGNHLMIFSIPEHLLAKDVIFEIEEYIQTEVWLDNDAIITKSDNEPMTQTAY